MTAQIQPKPKAYDMYVSKKERIWLGPERRYRRDDFRDAGDWDSNLLTVHGFWAGIFVIEQAAGAADHIYGNPADKRHFKAAVANT